MKLSSLATFPVLTAIACGPKIAPEAAVVDIEKAPKEDHVVTDADAFALHAAGEELAEKFTLTMAGFATLADYGERHVLGEDTILWGRMDFNGIDPNGVYQEKEDGSCALAYAANGTALVWKNSAGSISAMYEDSNPDGELHAEVKCSTDDRGAPKFCSAFVVTGDEAPISMMMNPASWYSPALASAYICAKGDQQIEESKAKELIPL